MTLQPAGYIPRIADAELARLLSLVGAVEIQGPKWCGKTWLGRSQANSEILIQDPTGNYRIRQLAQLEPLRVLEGDTPRLIDEWADVPGLWDAVRIQVDQQHSPGQFILTASSVPKDTATAHTGTGRIARMVLWPMSLAETGISTGEVSLGNLMSGNFPTGAMGNLDQQGLLSAILRGGWPDSVGKTDQIATELPSIYLDGLVHSDVSRIDGVLRDPVRMEALIASLARNTTTLASNTTLAKDMAMAESVTISPNTTTQYLGVLARLHILKLIPAWAPALRSPVRLRETPKRMLVDPSLAAAALRADADKLASDPKTIGLLFENLALRDLAIYATANNTELLYYHDNSDLETDAILSDPGGKWAAIEIKLGADQIDKAAKTLKRLSKKLQAGGEQPPQFLMVLVGLGTFAHRREDGIIVVPIDTLGP